MLTYLCCFLKGCFEMVQSYTPNISSEISTENVLEPLYIFHSYIGKVILGSSNCLKTKSFSPRMMLKVLKNLQKCLIWKSNWSQGWIKHFRIFHGQGPVRQKYHHCQFTLGLKAMRLLKRNVFWTIFYRFEQYIYMEPWGICDLF